MQMQMMGLMDPIIDQAIYYLDRLDQSNGLLIHLNRGPIETRGSNHNFDAQDGSKTILEKDSEPIEGSQQYPLIRMSR